MRAELQKLNSRLEAMSREELILSIRRLLEENAEKDARLEINSSAATEMAVQFQQIKNENAALKKENEELLRQNRNLTDQLQMRKNDLFGRKSENAFGTIDAVFEGSPEDPLDESSPEPEDTLSPDEPERTEAAEAYEKERDPQGSGRPRGRKTAGKRQKDLDRLPTKTHYDLDVDELNRMYGENNWRIAFWRREDTIESVHTTQYHQVKYRPIVSVGLEHELKSPSACTKVMPGSLASESLVAELIYQKIVQCVPSYRMESDFIRSSVPLSRQVITDWINRFSHDLFSIVAEHMGVLLLQRDHNQCDETVYQVIRDNRKAGTKSYMWVHTTSELDPGCPIIVFRFELTRKTEHLRGFYGNAGYAGNITSDAYCSYDVLEKEYDDIHGSGCLMHARRRFHYAAMLVRIKGKSPEAIRELPEIKALALIDAINDAETPLKGFPADERLQIRQTVVREKVDAYFDYLKSLNADDPAYSEKLRDAIQYSLNHEDKLRRFLDDPMIPADNGFCERCIKPFATARRNWLFSYSIYGAEAMAILFTLIETAKANGAHPYYYLKYLLEILPSQKTGKGNAFLNDCMPWSEKYRTYEKKEREEAMRFFTDQEPPERPRTPRKKDKCA